MALLKHKGGNLVTWDKGEKTSTVYYGPGLTKKCPRCKVEPHTRCVTPAGKLNGEPHSERVA